MQRIPPTTNADKPTDDAAFAKCVAAAAAIISRRLLDFARSPDFEGNYSGAPKLGLDKFDRA